MVADKVSSEDIKNLAKGVMKVTLPDYQACRSAMSLVTYTKDTWRESEDGVRPNYESSIDKESTTITITCRR
jgi:hypothetical protein